MVISWILMVMNMMNMMGCKKKKSQQNAAAKAI